MVPTKILVIDDTKSILDVLKDFFEFENYEVYTETNGQKGIESAKKNNPHLILCDVMMPVKNGYQVFEELKAIPETQNIPFLFLTADINIEKRRNDFGIDCIDYIIKPFNLSNLLSVVRRIIEKEI